MDLKELKERLEVFTGSDDFVDLESFQKEFSDCKLFGFEQFFHFNDDDYYSSTLFRTEKFEIRLLCWKPFQETPIHGHPQNGCLMRILEGELVEKKIDNTETETTYKKGDVSFITSPESHILRNTKQDSVSLHIYSPSGFYDGK